MACLYFPRETQHSATGFDMCSSVFRETLAPSSKLNTTSSTTLGSRFHPASHHPSPMAPVHLSVIHHTGSFTWRLGISLLKGVCGKMVSRQLGGLGMPQNHTTQQTSQAIHWGREGAKGCLWRVWKKRGSRLWWDELYRGCGACA